MQIVRNNGSAAISWFNSPQYLDEQGDTTIAVSRIALVHGCNMHSYIGFAAVVIRNAATHMPAQS